VPWMFYRPLDSSIILADKSYLAALKMTRKQQSKACTYNQSYCKKEVLVWRCMESGIFVTKGLTMRCVAIAFACQDRLNSGTSGSTSCWYTKIGKAISESSNTRQLFHSANTPALLRNYHSSHKSHLAKKKHFPRSSLGTLPRLI